MSQFHPMGLQEQLLLQGVRHHQQAALRTSVSRRKQQGVSLTAGCPMLHVLLARSSQMQQYSKFAHPGTRVPYGTYRPVKKIKRMLSMGYRITHRVSMKLIISSVLNSADQTILPISGRKQPRLPLGFTRKIRLKTTCTTKCVREPCRSQKHRMKSLPIGSPCIIGCPNKKDQGEYAKEDQDMTQQSDLATMFLLSGEDVKISYYINEDHSSELDYQDAHGSLAFQSDHLQIQPSAIGTLIT